MPLLSTILSIFVFAAGAQDPVKLAPKAYKILLENARARVLQLTLKPGERVALHSHPDYVMHSLTPFRVRFCGKAGACKDFDGPAGLTISSEKLEHSTENIGGSDFRVLIFELK